MQAKITSYLFIDGAYLRNVIEGIANRLGIPIPGSLSWQGPGGVTPPDLQPVRIFYYDAPPPRKSDESDADYERRLNEFEAVMHAMQERDGFFARSGYIRGHGKRARQKSVDIQIAVEMLTHAVRDNMEEAVLLSGDLDFKPVVDALVSLGTRVTVWAQFRTASKDLLASADRRRQFKVADMLRFLPRQHQQRYRLYGHGYGLTGVPPSGSDPGEILTSFGISGEREVHICKETHKNKDIYRIQVRDNSAPLNRAYWMHEALQYLLKYVSEDAAIALPSVDILHLSVTRAGHE